jgi:hypothetical protein
MSDARHFEQRVAAVVYAAERAVTRTEPTPGDGAPLPPAVDAPGPRATGLARRLGLGAAELDFLWTVVARAVEPRVGAHLRALYGGEARGGVSVGQHAHIAALDADTTRVVLAVIDPRHPLRRHGLIAPLVEDGEDVATRWTAPPRVWQYLRGDDALVGGVRHNIAEKLARWPSGSTVKQSVGRPGAGGRHARSGARPGGAGAATATRSRAWGYRRSCRAASASRRCSRGRRAPARRWSPG